MKTLLISTLCFFISCADHDPLPFDPYDASQIPGFWVSELRPDWSFWFTSDGVMLQREIQNGVELQRNEYAYHTAKDSIFCRDIYDGNARLFTVKFDSDTAAVLTESIGGLTFQQPIKRK